VRLAAAVSRKLPRGEKHPLGLEGQSKVSGTAWSV